MAKKDVKYTAVTIYFPDKMLQQYRVKAEREGRGLSPFIVRLLEAKK